jgi:hypothetical protein
MLFDNLNRLTDWFHTFFRLTIAQLEELFVAVKFDKCRYC